ncbi:MAG: (d)CMP kinase [Planctomycetes bacterium]|nr:(d)CMP kinase [Planctomycetota bacterium]
MIVTIDGPAGSGKSTISKMLAKELGATFLDTGAMYRAVTLAAIADDIDLADEDALFGVLESKQFEFNTHDNQMEVKINGIDATEGIRRPDITINVKYIAKAAKIRKKLVDMQRKFAKKHDKIVTEGRDQGTIAFPNADYKFFLIADVEERARRRHAEFTEKGLNIDLDVLEKDIRKRDESDTTRKNGPLIKAGGAIEIDSTKLDAEAVVKKILQHINP